MIFYFDLFFGQWFFFCLREAQRINNIVLIFSLGEHAALASLEEAARSSGDEKYEALNKELRAAHRTIAEQASTLKYSKCFHFLRRQIKRILI